MPSFREVIETLIAERDELRQLIQQVQPFLLRVIHPTAEGNPATLELRRRVNELCRLWSEEAYPCAAEPPSP